LPSLDSFSRQYWDLARNFPADLFGYKDYNTFRDEGVAPCESLAARIPAGARLLDIGSGGGLPGLVFAFLQPAAEIHLLEPRQKRWVFLREAAAGLGLKNVTAHRGQLPGFTFPDAAQPFSHVSIRALKLTPAMLKSMAPGLAPGAGFLLFQPDHAALAKAAGYAAFLSGSM
jgi:16S rRNA (guanine527-N7)-methyltransferase